MTRCMTATAMARALADGARTARDLVEQSLDRVDRHGDRAVFITLTADQARADATASDARRANGVPFSAWDGIPVAWKDLFDVTGTPTTAGSAVYAGRAPSTRSASVVAACARFGLISLGKTNLSEFAYSGLGLNPHFGTPVNPHSRGDARAPGGSSSGSAVAVASGIVPVAIGTDTAGSVRVPAAFCGVTGFKSSQERYDRGGVFSLSTSLDSLGAFAHSVEDLITIDAMMRGVRSSPPVTLRPDDLEILVPDTIVSDGLEPGVAEAFETAVGRLRAAGCRIERSAFPIFQEVSDLFARHGTLTVAEAATRHAGLLASDDAARMDPRVRARMMTAASFTAQDYVILQWERERLQAKVTAELGSRFMLFPTVAITAPSLAALEADDTHFVATNLMALRNTMLGNYLGMPGVSLPIGTDAAGLPVGALLSGPHRSDDKVLAASLGIEAAFRADDWRAPNSVLRGLARLR